MDPHSRLIHLLYVPTLHCNLGCTYCYLGDQTTTAPLREDSLRAVSTLQTALDRLNEANVLAFNVSLHGGEPTTIPPAILAQLFAMIRQHYLQHFDALSAAGHKKSAPHIKTNLYNFHLIYDLLVQHKVSISASIDLPLHLHGQYRTTQTGHNWLERTLKNLKLLAGYPHPKKLSATVSREHLMDTPAFVRDIWRLHREVGLDMNHFNLMFAFPSRLNDAHQGQAVLTPVDSQGQLEFYRTLHREFLGTELEEGLRRHWFDEFTPSYCTNSLNCGERFYLLQSDGSVYSCVRGQGIPEFYYGNLLTDPVLEVLNTGASKIRSIHQQFGFDQKCQGCGHLSSCHTGCPVVKFQNRQGRSYTCDLQKQMYQDAPITYPADDETAQRHYAAHYQRIIYPLEAATKPIVAPTSHHIRLPSDLVQDKNSLSSLIQSDEVLSVLFSAQIFVLEVGEELFPLESQLLQERRRHLTIMEGDAIRLHIRSQIWRVAVDEIIRNTLYLQMLRDTAVVYGDEQRTKQEHLFTYQLFHHQITTPSSLGEGWCSVDLTPLISIHQHLYQRGILNNLLVTTSALRDYHYQKQKSNAFYHIQAINLPFQNIEFYYLPRRTS